MFITSLGKVPEDPLGKKQWIRNNPHVCMLPFSVHGISVEFDGQKKVKEPITSFRNSCCCNLINQAGKNTTQKIAPDDFIEIQKSVIAQQLHPRCRVCQDSEIQTGSSERTLNLISTPGSEIQNFLDDGKIENFNFRVKFSNLCNLSCRSCSPTYSSKYAQSHGIPVPRTLSIDISDDPIIWKNITDSIYHYVDKFGGITLGLFGGETLMQPGAIKLIDHLIHQDISYKINLDITTNFTLFSKKMFDAMSRFKSVILKTSLDSTGQNYEYIRWPASWSTILNNLEIFSSEPRYHRMRFIIQPLFSLNNIFYVDEILNFWEQWQDQHPGQKFSISNVMMQRPQNMTIQNLPVIYREYLADIIQRAMENRLLHGKKYQSLQHYLMGMLDFCKSRDVIYDQFHLYLYETARHDQIYNTKMSVGNQKFYDILSETHKKLYEKFTQGSFAELLPKHQRRILHSLPL